LEGKEMRNFCFLPCITGLYEIGVKRASLLSTHSAQRSLYQTVHVNYSDNLIFYVKR